MKIALTVGHSLQVRGMRGSPVPPECDEVDECLKICTDVSQLLQAQGVECPMFFDTTSTSQSQYLANINNWVNAQPNTDLAVSCHLNAGGGDGPVGCEVWYFSQKTLAAKIATAMAEALDLPDRGPKYSNSLSFLVNTNPPAVLLECFFGDSTTDCSAYRAHYADLVEAIAESMAGIEIDDNPPEPEPPEPETPPSDDNRVNIRSRIRGDVTVIVNDTIVHGTRRCANVVDLQVTLEGDVIVIVNGEEFHNTPEMAETARKEHPEIPETPEFPANQMNIITTVFGGAGDPNNSAYPPYGYIDDEIHGVALPWKFQGERPQVRVVNPVTGQEVICDIVDLGPWLTDDEDYVMGDQRPLAETCHEENTPLPRGPNAGKVPNGAGIDLTPGAAKAIGISGKGKVHWNFVD